MMRNGEDLTVVSPGNQKRNFTHVEDIVDALILIGEYGNGDEYGIGHPDSYSILEVAEMFGGNIKMLKARRGNRMSAPVVSQNTQNLGWVPRKNLKDWVRTLNV
jgi:UDP-glucose 4-epimerase